MRWSTCSALTVLLISFSYTTALSVKSPENVSTQILKSIDQLVKTFNEPQLKVEIEPISSRGVVSDSVRRKLDSDPSKITKIKSEVPSPVQISSSSITINGANGTGGKRSRSLTDSDGVRTIEGVRVPDTEEDKAQTWRNARVIKGFLVPKDREANPHRKRQIYVQDATQFLASQGLMSPQSTLVDGSTLQTANQQQQALFYSNQPQQAQYFQNDGGIYGTAAPIQVTAVPYTQNQGQMYVLQQDGVSYAPYNPSYSNPKSQQFIARAGDVIQTATEQIQAASLAVPTHISQPQVSIISKATPHHLQTPQPSRTEEKVEKQKEQSSKLTKEQLQYKQAQQVLQDVQKQVEQQQAEEQFQQLQQLQAAQLQQQQEQQQQQQQQHGSTILIPQGGSTLIQAQVQGDSQQQQQASAQVFQVQQPQQQQIQTLIQAGNGQTYIVNHGQPSDTLEERVSTHNQAGPTQFVIKPQTYITGPGGQMFTVPVPIPAEQEENSDEQNEHQRRAQQHSGEQRDHRQRRPQQHDGERNEHRPRRPQQHDGEQNEHRQRRPQHHDGEENEHPQRRPSQHSGEQNDRPRRPPPQRRPMQRNDRDRDQEDSNKKPSQTFMNRIMEAFSVKGNAMERVETNIALPVLATTGVFFGLGALAAGWFLSSANREVGILRRTGKPVPGPPGSPNVQRIRRSAPNSAAEVDQATFFQSIIQQAIEKQQKEYDDVPEPHQGPPAGKPTPSRFNPPHKAVQRVPHNRNDYQEEHYETPTDSKVSSHRPAQSGSWLGSRQAINFAKVAIPAIVLGGAVLAIGAVIIGWYFTGSNREIAFLEPSAYSRRKRDLTTTALSDGWLQRLLSSIHENPYEGGASASITNTKDSVFDPDTSKHSSLEYHANLSDAVVAVSLAVVAFFSLMGIVLAWFFAENEKSNLGIKGPYGFGGWPGNDYRSTSRSRRSVLNSNELTSGAHFTHNPSFLESILTNLEVSQNSILNKLQETGYAKWQETPCAKRIFCDVMSAQSDDTVRAMEKRMSTFISMLPETLSNSLSRSLGEVIMSIQRRDCSTYTCGGHWVDPSIIDQPSPPSINQPR